MKYLKLGPKAKSFSDPFSGVVISGKEIIEVSNPQITSTKVAAAIRGNHLEISNESDYKAWKKTVIVAPVETKSSDKDQAKLVKELKAANIELQDEVDELKAKIEELEAELEAANETNPFEGKTDEDLIEFYNVTYEVTKKDLTSFTELDLEAKVKFLTDLEAE